MNTPILFFGFIRPEHTLRALASLAANAEAKNSRLFAFIDGPRRPEDEPRIAAVESAVRSRQWCGTVTVVRREKNWGAPRSVIHEITRYIEHSGSVIVLEDDIVLSPHFLRFMNAALSRYAEEPRVMEISGYRYPVENVSARSGFTGLSIGWGWATWKRAWSMFEPDGSSLLSRVASNKSLVRRFNLDGGFNFLEILRAAAVGKVGGWDIRWYASMLLRDGLTLYPARSLTANIGWDGSGSNAGKGGGNSGRERWFDTELSQEPVEDLPEVIEESVEFRRALRRFYLTKQGSLLRRIRLGLYRRLKQRLKAVAATGGHPRANR